MVVGRWEAAREVQLADGSLGTAIRRASGALDSVRHESERTLQRNLLSYISALLAPYKRTQRPC